MFDVFAPKVHIFAGVSELADDRDSKSCGEIRVGSSPTTGTVYEVSWPEETSFSLKAGLREAGDHIRDASIAQERIIYVRDKVNNMITVPKA